MQTLDAIKLRRTARSYKADQISKEDLKKVLDAAACAPVGAKQVIHYSVVQSKEMMDKLIESARAGMNQQPGFTPFYGAPTIVILSVDPSPIGADIANVACAAQNMLLAATDLGLGSIYLLGFIVMALIKDTEMQKALGIPEGKVPVAGIGLGYAADAGEPRDVVNTGVTYL